MINYKDHTLEEIIERATKIITLIDLGGDRRYLKTTIYGISGYNPHYCSLLVNAVTGICLIFFVIIYRSLFRYNNCY